MSLARVTAEEYEALRAKCFAHGWRKYPRLATEFEEVFQTALAKCLSAQPDAEAPYVMRAFQTSLIDAAELAQAVAGLQDGQAGDPSVTQTDSILLQQAGKVLARVEREVLRGYLEGRSFAEMARESGRSEATIRTHFGRAIAKIRRIVEEDR